MTVVVLIDVVVVVVVAITVAPAYGAGCTPAAMSACTNRL